MGRDYHNVATVPSPFDLYDEILQDVGIASVRRIRHCSSKELLATMVKDFNPGYTIYGVKNGVAKKLARCSYGQLCFYDEDFRQWERVQEV